MSNSKKMPLTKPPRREFQTFMDFPLNCELEGLGADDAHMAIMGIPYGAPYSVAEVTNDQSNAPTAIRRESKFITSGLKHWNFDVGGTIFDGRDIKVIDVGDVPASVRDLDDHYKRAEEATRLLLAANITPIVFGGDHGVPIPVMRALDSLGEKITLIQVDAHIDWRDHVNGVKEGYSSPIRRASEMDHIGDIFQIGIRGCGSAREEDYNAAMAYGSNIITAYDVHDNGMSSILERIPDGGHYYLTIDLDGLDPSVAPAVMAPSPGGLLFHQIRTLVHGLINKGRVVGMDLNEIAPKFDVNNVTSQVAGRIVLNFIGASVRAGYYD